MPIAVQPIDGVQISAVQGAASWLADIVREWLVRSTVVHPDWSLPQHASQLVNAGYLDASEMRSISPMLPVLYQQAVTTAGETNSADTASRSTHAPTPPWI